MKLDLSNRDLTSLDEIDLTGVTELDVSCNDLTTLPTLPSSLEGLSCFNNQLTSLPTLPSSLKKLRCWDNLLTSLPPLPHLLKELDCDNNLITSLPPLPPFLEILFCSRNHLTSLPPLPNSLKKLDCSECPFLKSLPVLPNLLIELSCDNSITSFPDLPYYIEHRDGRKLAQHNKKRADLGMGRVYSIPSKTEWDEIKEKHIIWEYRIGGEKHSKARNSLEEK